MFELMNEDELKITNQIYFKDIKYLKKKKKKNNKFYDDGTKEYYYEDKNKTYNVSIF